MLFYFDNTQKGVGLTFYNSRHRLALSHVNDMRCLGKVHAPGNYRRPNSKYHRYINHDVNHDVRMHLGR